MLSFLKKVIGKNNKSDKDNNKTVQPQTPPPVNEKKENRINEVMSKTGWSREKVVNEFDIAKETYGLTQSDYVKNEFYNVPDEDKQEVSKEILEKKARIKKFRQQCISLAMEKCGWSEEEAKKHIKETKERTGMGYLEYRRYHFFNIPEEEQVERYKEIQQSKLNRKNRDSSKKEAFYDVIMNETGWSRQELVDKIADAKQRTGATWKDYYAFRFWEIDEEEQAAYFTQMMSMQLADKYDVNDFHRDILLNKELSCYEFSEFFRRGWCINKTTGVEEFKNIFKDDKKVVYKPLDGNGGIGIRVFDVSPEMIEESYAEIAGLPRGVVEAFVTQHPEMNKITPSSVNTLRIVCMSTDKTSEVAYAALRIGSGKSFVDNFTDGGMVAGVDLETGTVVTNGVTVDGVSNVAHPETGTVFKGFKIPYFKEALEMAEAAGKKVVGYIGWDIAITENGPVLIEANIMPGNRILQMPYVEDRKGMRYVMERFL